LRAQREQELHPKARVTLRGLPPPRHLRSKAERLIANHQMKTCWTSSASVYLPQGTWNQPYALARQRRNDGGQPALGRSPLRTPVRWKELQDGGYSNWQTRVSAACLLIRTGREGVCVCVCHSSGTAQSNKAANRRRRPLTVGTRITFGSAMQTINGECPCRALEENQHVAN
jgi:hypothetical protein